MAVEKRFTQTDVLFPAESLTREMFKSSSQNDKPNDLLSLLYGHVAVSVAAVGHSPAASASASENKSRYLGFGSTLSHLQCQTGVSISGRFIIAEIVQSARQ